MRNMELCLIRLHLFYDQSIRILIMLSLNLYTSVYTINVHIRTEIPEQKEYLYLKRECIRNLLQRGQTGSRSCVCVYMIFTERASMHTFLTLEKHISWMIYRRKRGNFEKLRDVCLRVCYLLSISPSLWFLEH